MIKLTLEFIKTLPLDTKLFHKGCNCYVYYCGYVDKGIYHGYCVETEYSGYLNLTEEVLSNLYPDKNLTWDNWKPILMPKTVGGIIKNKNGKKYIILPNNYVANESGYIYKVKNWNKFEYDKEYPLHFHEKLENEGYRFDWSEKKVKPILKFNIGNCLKRKDDTECHLITFIDDKGFILDFKEHVSFRDVWNNYKQIPHCKDNCIKKFNK